MFRESDEARPNYHETYKNKSVSKLQEHCQNQTFHEYQTNQQIPSRRNDLYLNKCSATVNDPVPNVIPVTYDHAYDPENPDADWFESKFLSRSFTDV
jgi:hypothetical protein